MTKENNKVLVSVINWNNNAATTACLESIAAIPKPLQPDIRLVDNASKREVFDIPNATLQKLRQIEVVKNKQNLGFAAAHNDSLHKAVQDNYDFACLLNNDTEVAADAFQKLQTALMGNPNAIAAAPTILNNEGSIWYGGGRFSRLTSTPSHMRVGSPVQDLPTEVTTTEHLTGCCMMLSVPKLKASDLFLPEEYFMYWEDSEWSYRARKSGLELLYVPDASITHHVSSSLGIQSPTYIYYIIRNNILFIKRNTPSIHKPISYLKAAAIDARYEIKSFLSGWSTFKPVAKSLLQAWKDGLKNRGGKIEISND